MDLKNWLVMVSLIEILSQKMFVLMMKYLNYVIMDLVCKIEVKL